MKFDNNLVEIGYCGLGSSWQNGDGEQRYHMLLKNLLNPNKNNSQA